MNVCDFEQFYSPLEYVSPELLLIKCVPRLKSSLNEHFAERNGKVSKCASPHVNPYSLSFAIS